MQIWCLFLNGNLITSRVIVVELKWDKSAETAITQIKNKKYPDGLSQLSADEKIILVGISYERDGKEGDKKHMCRIEIL